MSETPEKTEKKDEKPEGAAPPADAEVSSDAEKGDADKGEAAEAAGAEADEVEGAEAAAEVEDDASPEAIARRVAALGDDDESAKLERAEELKLAERRAKMKRGKKGGGLEAAASKRLAKIAEKATPRKMIATAVDGADPLLNQTAKLSSWAKKNQKSVGTVVLVAGLAAAGVLGYDTWQQKKESDASAELSKAVADERGRIGDPDKEDEATPSGAKDTRPLFKTADDRRESALKKFRDIEARFPGTGAAILSRLSEGSLLLDAKKSDEAILAFNDVKASALGQADAEVRGRAIEGLGFAYEQKGALDQAVNTFKELESSVDVLGFKELGMYHQARVLELRNGGGDKEKAKELLKTVHERINKPGENYPFPYLKDVADDRLRALDPAALPPKPASQMGGPGGNKMSEEQMRKLIEQLKKQQGGGAP